VGTINQKLKLSFEGFIRKFPYDTWMTVTFKRTVSTEVAKKRLKQFLKHLNTANTVYYQKSVRLWAFFEKNTIGNGVHVHCLIDGMDTSKCPQLERECLKRFGQSTVTAGHANVIPYVAEKYNSTGLDDFDYMKVNSRYRQFNEN